MTPRAIVKSKSYVSICAFPIFFFNAFNGSASEGVIGRSRSWVEHCCAIFSAHLTNLLRGFILHFRRHTPVMIVNSNVGFPKGSFENLLRLYQ